MRVLYDNQIFCMERSGGISRMFSELFRAFEDASYEVEPEFVPYAGDNLYAHSCALPQLDLLPSLRIRGRRRLQTTLGRAATRVWLARSKIDLFHPTFYHPGFLRALGERPFVLTIHDMIPELYADRFAVGDPRTANDKRELARRARRVIAVSETTKQDIVRLLGVPAEKIDVVYHGTSMLPDSTRYVPDWTSRHYLLFVGRREAAYKNFATLLRAVKPILDGDREMTLLCVGGGDFFPGEQALLEELGFASRVVQRSLTDEGLAYAYRNATALLYPSFYEGFGMPILEGFAAGCPVVASDIPVFREIAGDGALYFDPHQAESLEEAVVRICRDARLRDSVVEAGRRRSERFSWQRCARETAAAYKRALV